MQNIGADGIRADVATIKPSNFWVEIIEYARKSNSEFLFLAEASDSWREPPSKYAEFTPYDKLLLAGFDGYYGSFFNLKDWKTAEPFIEHIKFGKELDKFLGKQTRRIRGVLCVRRRIFECSLTTKFANYFLN